MKFRDGIFGVTLTSALALSAFSANAADMYRGEAPGGYKDGPIYVANTWTGFYVGASVGAAWGTDDIVDKNNLNGGAHYSIEDTSVIGGGQFGYNWQRDHLVFGVEADIGGIGFNKKKFDPNFPGGTYSGIDSGVYGDVTGRLGYAFDRTLLYAKGGFAFYDGEAFVDNTAGGFGGGRAKTDTFTGWTIGGGIEHMFSPNWSVKVEYQYFDFGTQDATLITPTHGTFAYSNDLTVQSVKAGVNYHFASSYEPLK